MLLAQCASFQDPHQPSLGASQRLQPVLINMQRPQEAAHLDRRASVMTHIRSI
jgi:hypothetical protein